jgi:predicted Zn-dependent protease
MTPAPMVIRGRLREGAIACEIPVEIQVDGDALLIAGAEKSSRVPRDTIRADAPLPGVARMLTLPDGSQIETDDGDAVAMLFATPSRIDAAAYWLESRWAAALASIPLIAVLAWLVVGVLLPRAADPVARMVSPRIELVLGKRTLATLDRVALKPSRLDADTRLRIERQFRSFVAGERGEEKYQLAFRSGMGPNAFALPGGIIVVTDEMVKLAESDAELIAVLAHEIGHVRGRHALRLILQDSGVIVLVTALAGDAASMTLLAAALPTVLLQSHYSREFETEADDYAFAQLKSHGVSPQAFADMMQRLQRADRGASQSGALRYFSTHPLTEERIEQAEKAGSRP